jgi:hypothetical protein
MAGRGKVLDADVRIGVENRSHGLPIDAGAAGTAGGQEQQAGKDTRDQ